MKRLFGIMLLCTGIFLSMAFSHAWGADPPLTVTPDLSFTVTPDLSFTVNSSHINFSTPTQQSLDTGYVEKGGSTDSSAIEIRITGGTPIQRWELSVNAADDMFSPAMYGKACADLVWKLEGEGPNAYRPMRTSNQRVASGSGGETVTTFIDLRMLVDWSDPPANYSLRVNFTLAVE